MMMMMIIIIIIIDFQFLTPKLTTKSTFSKVFITKTAPLDQDCERDTQNTPAPQTQILCWNPAWPADPKIVRNNLRNRKLLSPAQCPSQVHLIQQSGVAQAGRSYTKREESANVCACNIILFKDSEGSSRIF